MGSGAVAVSLLQAGEQLGVEEMIFAGGSNPELVGLDHARVALYQAGEDLLFAFELRGVGKAVKGRSVKLVFDGRPDFRRSLAAGQGG